MLYDYFNEHEVNLFIILVHTVYAVLLIVPSCVAYGLVAASRAAPTRCNSAPPSTPAPTPR